MYFGNLNGKEIAIIKTTENTARELWAVSPIVFCSSSKEPNGNYGHLVEPDFVKEQIALGTNPEILKFERVVEFFQKYNCSENEKVSFYKVIFLSA